MNRFEYMWIPIKDIPAEIMQQYKLDALAVNGKVMVEIRKGMYGLVQAGKIANVRLQEHLAKHQYFPCTTTPGLYRHSTRPIAFALVVDDFGVKYERKADALHLQQCLKALYEVTTDWTGELYLGITLAWDYTRRFVELSMPGYIDKALQRFGIETPSRLVHAPHTWSTPIYGQKTQLTSPPDSSPDLGPTERTRLQEVVGVLLYLARAIDPTLLATLGTIGTNIHDGTERTAAMATHLLNYCASHRNPTIRFYASSMIVCGHTDASYLSVVRSRSRAAG
jgi:hypothetical protein